TAPSGARPATTTSMSASRVAMLASIALSGASRKRRLNRELDHDGHMVRRLVKRSRAFVDRPRDKPVGRPRRQKHVIDTNAIVLLPGTGLVVPIGIVAGVAMAGAESVGQPEIYDATECLARFRLIERVVHPIGRVLCVLARG